MTTGNSNLRICLGVIADEMYLILWQVFIASLVIESFFKLIIIRMCFQDYSFFKN